MSSPNAVPLGHSASPSTTFCPASEHVNFCNEELKVLEYWRKIDAFQTSMKLNEKLPVFNFYDGPPFATGLPHYGHILAGTIKDIVTRFAHQTGHHVTRRAGWDCHGLPIEYVIDQEFNIKSKDDVMKMGVDKYNAECRKIVLRYTKEWESTVGRMGRWIDFKNDYKTMDPSFMESVWWVFSQLYKKGLVYRGYKVMPYSTACTTPLSNFEAGLNYKDVKDPTVVVSFPMVTDAKTLLLAWTTTPWTLPSNLALAVNPKMDYCKVKDFKTGLFYILMKARLEEVYPPKKKGAENELDYQMIEEFKGSSLAGQEYEPLFPYYAAHRKSHGAFRVLLADYVTADSGTGIVHQAPAFGEDDYNVCAANGIVRKGEAVICPVDESGRFTDDVKEFAGKYVKDADKDIIKFLKEKCRIVKVSQIDHSYPHCWRSETPLIYRAVPSWFVNVERLKERLLANNAETYWVPAFVKEKRFHNWLTDARDWAISRNRYWGTPLPMWVSEDGSEVVAVESIKQLEELTGVTGITDIHKDRIDHLTIIGKTGILRRTPEVFDCWFESGSMPYAQQHYPFENKESFEASFPADFIAEGLDQTRGWFYTLMVLSTALFDKPAWKNLIVNGLVLAGDGKKMSKKLKNYPDPLIVVSKYGADALRVYLINSPVVRAEPVKFQETGVLDVIKTVFLPWFHAYRFFLENALRFAALHGNGAPFCSDAAVALASSNVMDQWILASLQSLIRFVREEMAAYRLYTVVPRLLDFIELLTNWYVRMNRKRLKGGVSSADGSTALNTLFLVLITLTQLMAPFTPFLVETMYQNLRAALPPADQRASVHYLRIPEENSLGLYGPRQAAIEITVRRMRTVVELGRQARATRELPVKKPLKHLLVVHQDPKYLEDLRSMDRYLREEMNVRTVEFSCEEEKFIKQRAEPNRKVLGPRLGVKATEIAKLVEAMNLKQIADLRARGKILLAGETVTKDELDIVWEFVGDSTTFQSCGNNEVLVVLNVEQDDELVMDGYAREVVRTVQKLRKKAGLVPTDPVEVFLREIKGETVQVAATAELRQSGADKTKEKASEKPKRQEKEKEKEMEKAESAPKADKADKSKAKQKETPSGEAEAKADAKPKGDMKAKAAAEKADKTKKEKAEKKAPAVAAASSAFASNVTVMTAVRSSQGRATFHEALGRGVYPWALMAPTAMVLVKDVLDVEGQTICVEMALTMPSFAFSMRALRLLQSEHKQTDAWSQSLVEYVGNKNYNAAVAKKVKEFKVSLNGVNVILVVGVHVFYSMTDFEKTEKTDF